MVVCAFHTTGPANGSRAWAALAALAAARRVEGVLVPSTDAALLFGWAAPPPSVRSALLSAGGFFW